jgi:hypothetical protein
MIIQSQRSVCPRCGAVVPVRPPALTETSIDIWEAGGRLFWLGKRMTIRALAGQVMTRSSPLVRFGSRWRDAPGLLDWRCEDGALSVMLSYAALRAARKDVSIATAAWLLGGREYQTTMMSVVPGDGTVRVSAREIKVGAW